MNAVKSVLLPAAMIATVFAISPASADWLRFRGPNGSGISDSTAPTEFGENKNLKWKVELPGRGISSPIVVGDKVFVTSYTGYGGDLGSNIEDLKRHLICVDRASGKIAWKKTVDATMPEDEWRPPVVTTHGYASIEPKHRASVNVGPLRLKSGTATKVKLRSPLSARYGALTTTRANLAGTPTE